MRSWAHLRRANCQLVMAAVLLFCRLRLSSGAALAQRGGHERARKLGERGERFERSERSEPIVAAGDHSSRLGAFFGSSVSNKTVGFIRGFYRKSTLHAEKTVEV